MIEFDLPVYSRTGSTTFSFSSSSQIQYANIAFLAVNTFMWTNTALNPAGIAQYEYVMVPHVLFEWVPTQLTAVQGTFQPSGFNLRYVDGRFDNTDMPTNYFASQIPVNLQCLPTQTSRPQQFSVVLTNAYRAGNGNEACLGQLIAASYFSNNPMLVNGILVLNQPVATVNTISSYNPVVGVIKVTIQLELINALTG